MDAPLWPGQSAQHGVEAAGGEDPTNPSVRVHDPQRGLACCEDVPQLADAPDSSRVGEPQTCEIDDHLGRAVGNDHRAGIPESCDAGEVELPGQALEAVHAGETVVSEGPR